MISKISLKKNSITESGIITVWFLVAILGLIGFLAITQLFSFKNKNASIYPPIPAPRAASEPIHPKLASLSLEPSSGVLNKNCNVSFQIKLDTGGGNTDGTDAVLLFDPKIFRAVSIQDGNFYPDYPGNSIDNNLGRVSVSGISQVENPVSGQGVLAIVNLKVRSQAKKGMASIKFDFDPNDKTKTTDSNVVERGTIADILSKVKNGSFRIDSGNCSAGNLEKIYALVTNPSKQVNLTPSTKTTLSVTLLDQDDQKVGLNGFKFDWRIGDSKIATISPFGPCLEGQFCTTSSATVASLSTGNTHIKVTATRISDNIIVAKTQFNLKVKTPREDKNNGGKPGSGSGN